MADILNIFEVPDNDFVELSGAGVSGSIIHQGGVDGGKSSSVVLIESSTKPSFSLTDPDRFQKNPISQRINQGDSAEPYFDAVKIWAVSTSGSQYISVTPSV